MGGGYTNAHGKSHLWCMIKHFYIKMLEKIIQNWNYYILMYIYISDTILLPFPFWKSDY